MRKYTFKFAIIALCIVGAVYYLYPSYRDYSLQKELRSLTGADSVRYLEENEGAIRDARAKRIKLGLDLQGGMRVVLEVNVLKLIEELAKSKDDVFTQIVAEVQQEAKRSDESPVLILRRTFEERQIRLSRYYGSLRDDNDKIYAYLNDEAEKAIDRGIQIVRNRVDQYGVSEPGIQKLGANRIIVELPGVSRESEVRQLLQGTALLEFKLLKDYELSYRILQSIDQALVGALVDTADTAAAKPQTAVDTSMFAGEEELLGEDTLAARHPLLALIRGYGGDAVVAAEDRDRVRRLLSRPEAARVIPADFQFLWSAKPVTLDEAQQFYSLYSVKRTPELTGGVVVDAKATLDPNSSLPIVTMEMNSEGSRDWARITGANVNKRIAIILDDAVFSAPVVRNKITGGRSQIEGMDNLDEARLLEIVLKAGALPAPVEIIEQRSVGPSLGEDSIKKGLLSAAVATALTMLFMVLYYRGGGAVADAALALCLMLLLAILAAFHGTLTLPGIAGIILTLAVGVDANVLINERIREELATGKTIRAALDAGYEKAFSAIFDSNLTTFITAVILYQFGSGAVQGFALTLMIGIVASMFTAIFVTKVVFHTLTDRSPTAVSFG